MICTNKSILTWISVVEIILNITCNVMFLLVLDPVSISFFIITHKDPKKDDHSNLPHKANNRKADPDISVLRRVPEPVATVSHCNCS